MTESSRHVPEHLDAGELFRRHARFVARFLWKMGVARHDVEDALQEVFLVAHRQGGFVERDAQPTTWLAEIAFRVASTRRRDQSRRGDVFDNGAVAAARDHAPSPSERAELAEGISRVQRALEALDLIHRAVFVLYELEGHSGDEIARALGIPVGTVYSRLHHARARFTDAHEQLANPRAQATDRVLTRRPA